MEPKKKAAPPSKETLVACSKCYFLQTQKYFNKHGCPNCNEGVNTSTTNEYEGCIAIIKPSRKSWVCRYLGLTGNVRVRGLYAMRIKGGQDSDKEDDYNEDEVEDEDIEQDNSY